MKLHMACEHCNGYIKHISMLTEMIASDHEIIQDLKREIFLERHRNDRRTNEATEGTTKEVP
jgi:hypothetical protein